MFTDTKSKSKKSKSKCGFGLLAVLIGLVDMSVIIPYVAYIFAMVTEDDNWQAQISFLHLVAGIHMGLAFIFGVLGVVFLVCCYKFLIMFSAVERVAAIILLPCVATEMKTTPLGQGFQMAATIYGIIHVMLCFSSLIVDPSKSDGDKLKESKTLCGERTKDLLKVIIPAVLITVATTLAIFFLQGQTKQLGDPLKLMSDNTKQVDDTFLMAEGTKRPDALFEPTKEDSKRVDLPLRIINGGTKQIDDNFLVTKGETKRVKDIFKTDDKTKRVKSVEIMTKSKGADEEYPLHIYILYTAGMEILLASTYFIGIFALFKNAGRKCSKQEEEDEEKCPIVAV